jgi:hypothetical protein
MIYLPAHISFTIFPARSFSSVKEETLKKYELSGLLLMMTFSTTPSVIFHLDQYYDPNVMVTEIMAAPYTSLNTYTGLAMEAGHPLTISQVSERYFVHVEAWKS